MIVVDIWGGEGSGVHVARFLRSIDDALVIARTELAKGYLVNLRDEVAWGSFKEFDARQKH